MLPGDLENRRLQMLCKIHDMENALSDSGVVDEDPSFNEQQAQDGDNISVSTQQSNVTAVSSASSGDAGKSFDLLK